MAVGGITSVEVGGQAPDFTLRSLDGEDVSLSRYCGKKLVIFMWASW
jgi:peroxiredoxin